MNRFKYLNDADAWMLAEEIPDIDFQFSEIWLSSFVNDLERTIGTNYKKVMSVYDGYNLKFYYGEKDAERISNRILELIVNEGFGKKINRNIKASADILRKTTDKISKVYLRSLTNPKLGNFYKKLDDVHTEAYTWGWLSNAVDMFYPHFTEHLKTILRTKLDSEEKINSSLVALSFYTEKSFVQEEHESLLNIALLKKQNPNNQSGHNKKVKEHLSKYFYLKHLWIGKDGISTEKDIEKAVDGILKTGDPATLLKEEDRHYASSLKLREDLLSHLALSMKEKELFDVYAEFAFTKMYRRKAQIYWAYKMDFLFEELSKRLGISIMQSRFMLPSEVVGFLSTGIDSKFRKILGERVKHCVLYEEKGIELVEIGKEAQEFESTIVKAFSQNVTEFKGQVACVGKVRGIVKIVNTPKDISKVKEGDILVSIATNPDILPAMKKAIAFITEQGGITSHAAIVAREMRKPCIIGTKIATKVLKDGDMVEVDAERGIITIVNY